MKNQLVNLIVCPVTQTKLEWDQANNCLISREANLVYPIQNGIPVLLPEAGKTREE